MVRPALLWNDTRSAAAAADLVAELGPDGAQRWAEAVGSVPVAAFTVAKLRWLAEHEPEQAPRAAAVCLPHDWLTWRLGGAAGLDALTTDRGDVSGTGYWSPATGNYRTDLLRRELGAEPHLPTVLGPADSPGRTTTGAVLGAGTGDNAAAALGLGAVPGDVVVSFGTSGVVSAVALAPAADPNGSVAGFADATGNFLPLVCTLNAARVLDAAGRLLGVDHDALSRLALSAPAGADGLVVVPYLEGERTPTCRTPPVRSTGCGWRPRRRRTCPGRRSRACCAVWRTGSTPWSPRGPGSSGCCSSVGAPGPSPCASSHRRCSAAPSWCLRRESYVADGAARQAAWVLSGGEAPPDWGAPGTEAFHADPVAAVRERYAEVRGPSLPGRTPTGTADRSVRQAQAGRRGGERMQLALPQRQPHPLTIARRVLRVDPPDDARPSVPCASSTAGSCSKSRTGKRPT